MREAICWIARTELPPEELKRRLIYEYARGLMNGH